MFDSGKTLTSSLGFTGEVALTDMTTFLEQELAHVIDSTDHGPELLAVISELPTVSKDHLKYVHFETTMDRGEGGGEGGGVALHHRLSCNPHTLSPNPHSLPLTLP